MAATKRNAMLIEEAREKIKTTQLINRLQNHALGEIEMSPTQIKATEVLLKKRVPDLQSMTLQGDDDGGAIKATVAPDLTNLTKEQRDQLRGILSRVTVES
jgi:hypothetical protein